MRTSPALFVLFACAAPVAHAQFVTADYILDQEPENVVRADTACSAPHCFRIRCGFGSAEIIDTALVAWIRSSGVSVGRIDLVYTSYRLTSDFDQKRLNRARLESLRALFPELFENNLTEWHLVRQNGLREAELGERFFHGFIIRPHEPTKAPDKLLRAAGIKPDHKPTTTEELLAIDEYLKGGRTSYITKRSRIRCSHYYLPRARNKIARGKHYARRSIWRRKQVTVCDTLVFDPVIGSVIPSYPFLDSVVFKVFERNTGWTNAVIVEDITGSMYPYTAQTLVWRRLQQAATPYVRFVFFNDGDAMPDGPIGRSGGAYAIASDSVAPIEAAAFDAMRKGGGGGTPENDIEAMLHAQKAFPDLDALILIADNWAPVRDLSLLAELRVPVHVVLCGSPDGRALHHYVDIALATQGSVHTIESDLYLLSGAVEGHIIHIGDQKFKVHKGRLQLVR